MDWILHLDTDELIHPAGTREYSLRKLLSDVPDNVDMVVFPNYVSYAFCDLSLDGYWIVPLPSLWIFLLVHTGGIKMGGLGGWLTGRTG